MAGGAVTSSDSRPQDVPKEGAHYKPAASSSHTAEVMVLRAGTENRIENNIQTAGRLALALAEGSALATESGSWGTLSHDD